MLSILSGLILGVAVMFFVATADQLVCETGDNEFVFNVHGGETKSEKVQGFFLSLKDLLFCEHPGMAIAAGALVAVVAIFSPMIAGGLVAVGAEMSVAKVVLGVLIVTFYVAMIVASVLLMVWWHKEGYSVPELCWFAAIAVVFYLTTGAVAQAIMALNPGAFLASVITTLPLVMLVMTLGYFLFNFFHYRRKYATDRAGQVYTSMSVVTGVVAVSLLIAVLFNGIAWGQANGKNIFGVKNAFGAGFGDQSGIVDGYDQPGMWLSDAKGGAYDFAAAKEVAKECDNDRIVMMDYAGRNQVETLADYLANLPEAKQPDGFKGLTILETEAKLESLSDKDYDAVVNHFYSVMDGASMRYTVLNGNYDNAYMRLIDEGGSVTHQNMELVYCTTQETNLIVTEFYWVEGGKEVGSMMVKITPVMSNGALTGLTGCMQVVNPQGSSVYTGMTYHNPDNPGGDNPGPGPGPNDGPKKDPSKLTPVNTEPNDNTGPGENTIDPNDPNHSKKDRSDNSTSYPSYGAYQDWMGHLGDVNANQRVGGDSNQPSTETPTGTNVDNNAANGTGYGGIDTPTPVSDPSHEAGTGEVINTDPGKPWGGPTD